MMNNWSIKKTAAIIICLAFSIYPLWSLAEKSDGKQKINFAANSVEEDTKSETITARGNVEIERDGMLLKADEIKYNRQKDIITANGNVSISQPDGSVFYADSAQLEDKMSKGTIKDVKVVLADKSRIAAQRIKQAKNKNKYFFYGVYSPCDVCQENPNPLWQIKARKIMHDAKNKNVNYRDAFVEIKNVPVFYTPFLSHPDPSVKRRSGFLPPSLRSNSYLGSSLQLRYFWNISDNEDVLFSPLWSANQGVVWGGEYRKMLHNGDLKINTTFMKDKDSKDMRGSIFAKGRYEIDDFWVGKFDINYASDGTYLKDLSLAGKTETWLTSKASLERFDRRDYASIEAYSYKLVSYNLRNLHLSEFQKRDYSKPYIMPLATYETLSEPDQYGSYFKNTFNLASVYRERDETQTQRATMINSWNLPYTSSYGEKYRISASVKSDLYYVDQYSNQEDEDYTGSVGRVFPQVGVEWRLPFVKATSTSRQIIEPIIVAVAAPDGGNKTNKIPNEDSLDAQLSDTNILSLDRYSGYDRNDTGSRVSYGINWSSYGNIIGRTSMFIAQSYYLQDDESFSRSLGDTNQLSDYVGRVYAAPHQYLDFNYRFRLDKNNLDLKYSELNSRIGTDMLSTNIAFISIKGRPQNSSDSSLYFFDDYQTRRELYTSIQAKISRDWRAEIYNRQDLVKGGIGSLEHGGNLIYEDECFGLSFNVHKYNSTDPDYDDGYEFSVNFLLKTLGGVGSN